MADLTGVKVGDRLRVTISKEHYDLLILSIKRNSVILAEIAAAMKTPEAKLGILKTVEANATLIRLVEQEVTNENA